MSRINQPTPKNPLDAVGIQMHTTTQWVAFDLKQKRAEPQRIVLTARDANEIKRLLNTLRFQDHE